MSRKHWGEISEEEIHIQAIPNIMSDIERCMDTFCLSEYEDETETELTENLV